MRRGSARRGAALTFGTLIALPLADGVSVGVTVLLASMCTCAPIDSARGVITPLACVGAADAAHLALDGERLRMPGGGCWLNGGGSLRSYSTASLAETLSVKRSEGWSDEMRIMPE
jgi:hypothetical protein